MAAYNKFQQFVEDIANKVHDLASDVLKVMLTNAAPVATNEIFGDLTEITAENGYAAGGPVVTVVSCVHTAGVLKLIIDDEVITASGGSIGPFRYTVLYNDESTSPADPLIGWWDYGSSITLNDGETYTVDFDGSAGVLTIT